MSSIPLLLGDIKITDKIHISNEDEENIKYKPVPIEEQVIYIKPCGLWYAYGKQWIYNRKNYQHIHDDKDSILKYTYKIDITPKTDKKMFTITSFEGLLIFDKTFRVGSYINWVEFSKICNGIAIYNKVDYGMITKEHRTTNETIINDFKSSKLNYDLILPKWYTGWDIGSGCIWGDVNVTFTKIRSEDEGEGEGAIRDSFFNRICCGFF